MIVTTNTEGIPVALARLGVADVLSPHGSAVIKINLPCLPGPKHPRTHPELIRAVVSFIRSQGASCVIAEGADGFLQQNIEGVGLADFLKKNGIRLIDLDLEQDLETIVVGDETHYIPRCLADFACRIAIPAISWPPGLIFSNNVKLFVGAVPLGLYQDDTKDNRALVHINLHQSVANIYRAVMRYCPFQFFVNGGTSLTRVAGTFELPHVYVGNNALELDSRLVTEIGAEIPEYLEILRNESPNNEMELTPGR